MQFEFKEFAEQDPSQQYAAIMAWRLGFYQKKIAATVPGLLQAWKPTTTEKMLADTIGLDDGNSMKGKLYAFLIMSGLSAQFGTSNGPEIPFVVQMSGRYFDNSHKTFIRLINPLLKNLDNPSEFPAIRYIETRDVNALISHNQLKRSTRQSQDTERIRSHADLDCFFSGVLEGMKHRT